MPFVFDKGNCCCCTHSEVQKEVFFSVLAWSPIEKNLCPKKESRSRLWPQMFKKHRAYGCNMWVSIHCWTCSVAMWFVLYRDNKRRERERWMDAWKRDILSWRRNRDDMNDWRSKKGRQRSWEKAEDWKTYLSSLKRLEEESKMDQGMRKRETEWGREEKGHEEK